MSNKQSLVRIDLLVSVQCVCGSYLGIKSSGFGYEDTIQVEVEPCSKCIKKTEKSSMYVWGEGVVIKDKELVAKLKKLKEIEEGENGT